MRSMKLALGVFGAVLALGVFGVSSASALPLFVSKSGKYPIHSTIHGGEGHLQTASGHEVTCSLVSGLALLGLRLSLLLLEFHKCSTTILFSKPECNSAGAPKGLIITHNHAWLGYLTNAAGEKMVGMLAQPEAGGIDAEFECVANSFEHVKSTVLGEVVGAIPASEVNKSLSKFTTHFESTGGKQSVQTFLLPAPLSLMTGVHLTTDITGSVEEKVESGEQATGEAILEPGGETAEIQG